MASAVGTQPAGFAALSRAVVAATADLVQSVERRVIGEERLRTARDNAFEAMSADRARARERAEMDALVRSILASSPRAAGRAPVETEVPAPPAARRNRRAKALAG